MTVSSAHPFPASRRRFSRLISWRSPGWTAVFIGGLILAGSLFGLATRSAGLLAAIWPTTAVLLGAMVRWPHLASPVGWAVVVIGLPVDNIVNGGLPGDALLQSSADLIGILTGYFMFSYLDAADRCLRHPMSVIYLSAIVVTASAMAGLVGIVANPILFDRSPMSTWSVWMATELVNYIAILPVVLTLPSISWRRLIDRRRSARFLRFDPPQAIPVLALVVSCIGGLLVGGPGAVAFPVPALLWCAVTYSLFSTAVLTLLFSAWTLTAISLGQFVVMLDHESQHAMMSIRLGVALMAIAPITVASVMSVRNQLLMGLQHMATHDPLTDLLNRRAFADIAGKKISAASRLSQPVAFLMLDIDHFKLINDTYGHGAGDQVLSKLAASMRSSLREDDVLGRLGGEEFAVLLGGCSPEQATVIAERVRTVFATTIVDLYDGRRVTATVSIGLAVAGIAPGSIEPLMLAADKALYAAKSVGRNRVVRAAPDAAIRIVATPPCFSLPEGSEHPVASNG
ncbi:MAG: diguanylate cyclase [Hyphomicrobiaceae bacterium]